MTGIIKILLSSKYIYMYSLYRLRCCWQTNAKPMEQSVLQVLQWTKSSREWKDLLCHQVQPRVWWVICIQCWKLVECFHVEKLRKLMRVSRCIFSAMMQNKKTVQYFCTATSITVAPLLSATQWLLLIALLSSSHCQQRPTLPLLML